MERRREDSARDEGPPPAEAAEPAEGSRPAGEDDEPQRSGSERPQRDLRVRTLRQENDESGGH